MTTKVTMPQLGESVIEGEIGDWLVQEGQAVERDQPLVTILTDKTDTELPAPAAGVLTKIHANTGDIVQVGQAICEIDATATATATPAAAPKQEESKEEFAPGGSPSVRKLARELSVNIDAVKGSGEGGRITHEDVHAAAKGPSDATLSAAVPPPAPTPQPAARRPAGKGLAMKFDSGSFRLPPYVMKPGDELVPFTRRRRITADHMVYSKLTSPHVVTFAETDLHSSAKLRNKHKGELKAEGISLSFLSFVAAATVQALRETRSMNSRVLDGEYVRIKEINLGIAVQTDGGLIVPVIRHADELSVRGLARAIGELAKKAREGQLTPDDLSGKTFTISNPGRKGNLVGGAIISQPNVGILRMGEIKKRVVVVDQDGVDAMVIHPVMYMALSYDHRIVDGVEANSFLYRIDELLEAGDFAI